MGLLRKVFYGVIIIVALLVILTIAAFFYGAHEVTSPPEEFRVIETKIDDFDGFPSLIVKFETKKYTLLTFKLFDESGNLLDIALPSEGQTAVALALGDLYENIVGEKKYVLKVYYGDDPLYEEEFTIQGAKISATLVDLGVKPSFLGLDLEYLVVEIKNEGDVPLYINSLNTDLYADGETILVTVPQSTVIKPGETQQVRFDLLGTVQKTKVTLKLNIDGVETSFTVDLTNYIK